jgi:threonine dehydratase
MNSLVVPIPLQEIKAASDRIRHTAVRTPLLRLPVDTGKREVYLKLENLQPIGSFKLRGAANAMALSRDRVLAEGVYTASAGNMAQGVAWCARELGVRCQVIVPEGAPKTKTDAIERLSGTVIKVPFDDWWQAIVNHGHPGMQGLFIHPFADPAVMAGNGTIALEVMEDLDNVDAILIPFGGGGLACGIASAIRAVSPRTRTYAVEVETAAPLTASFASGKPTSAPSYTRTFVDGIGAASISEEMWPLLRSLLAGTVVVTLAEIVAAIKLLAERCRVIAEGAGAASVAAALHSEFDGKRVVCIVSGGNIDMEKLTTILHGDIP